MHRYQRPVLPLQSKRSVAMESLPPTATIRPERLLQPQVLVNLNRLQLLSLSELRDRLLQLLHPATPRAHRVRLYKALPHHLETRLEERDHQHKTTKALSVLKMADIKLRVAVPSNHLLAPLRSSKTHRRLVCPHLLIRSNPLTSLLSNRTAHLLLMAQHRAQQSRLLRLPSPPPNLPLSVNKTSGCLPCLKARSWRS